MRTPISLGSLAWKQAGSLAADVELTDSSLPESEEKTESSECCSPWWCLVWTASKQCLAVLREYAALQSVLSKVVTKELWPENHSKMQAGLYVWNIKKCWDSFEEFAIRFSFRSLVVAFVPLNGIQSVIPHISSDSFEKLILPPHPLNIHVRKSKVWNCELLRHLSVHKVTGKTATFFVLSTAMPHTFTMSVYDLVASHCLWRDALYCPLLCCFFSEEEYTFPCSAS